MKIKPILDKLIYLSRAYHTGRPYIVGGLPRDIYLQKDNIKTNDIDITTNSSEVLRLGILLAEELNVTFELSDDGHVTVFADKFDLDFSSNFVSSGVVDYLNGKKKGFEEAFSRDFTINTLHQDIVTGKIIDPTEQGFEDIKNKIIRTPVPADITLRDDPRRIYRAINISARYGYEVDSEILNFAINNEEVFTSENIKDKFITAKINKALDANREHTLELLKKMNLFKRVPLVGKFKDILIEEKMLSEYLDSNNE